MTIQLRYDLVTDPFPLRASPRDGGFVKAQLTVVAANPNADPGNNPVILHGLSITVPVGPDADKLAVKEPPLPVPPEGWQTPVAKTGEGVVVYDFTPKPGKGVISKQGLVIVFNDIEVNTWPGPSQITITEGTPGNPAQTLPVTKFPAGWGTVACWLNPPDVPYGGSTTLNWDGPESATYTIEFAHNNRVYHIPAQGEPALGSRGQYPAQGEEPLLLTQTTLFTLDVTETISGLTYRAQQQKTAEVQVPAPTIIFTVTPSTFHPAGVKPVRLQWKTENASQVVIGDVGNFTGPEAEAGSAVVTPMAAPPVTSVTYLAEAHGLTGYSGPPALGQASVLIIWSQTSPWLDVWNAPPGVLWSLVLNDGQLAFDLVLEVETAGGVRWKDGENVQMKDGEYRRITVRPAPGVLITADPFVDGVNTPLSKLSEVLYADTWAWSIYKNIKNESGYADLNQGDSSEWTEQLGRGWGLKFQDGRLLMILYEDARSDSTSQKRRVRWPEMLNDKWQFTFGWIYYTDPNAP